MRRGGGRRGGDEEEEEEEEDRVTEGERESVVAKLSSACGEKIVLWWVDFARRKWWKLCVCVWCW